MPPSNGPSATSFTPGPNFKLGAMKKKCGGLQKWAVRYLILDKPNKILYYYHSTKDASPRRALDLNTCTISRLTPDESPRDPGFKVTQPGVREFIFIGSNAAIVDDWVNAIFQAKAPSQNTTQSFIGARNTTQSPQMGGFANTGPYNPNSPVKSSTASSDNFSYNGPTLAVLPNRGTAMASPPMQNAGQQPGGMMPPPLGQQPYTQQGPLPPLQGGNTIQAQTNSLPPPQRPPAPQVRPTQVQSARSTQSSMNDNTNNTTLVGGGGSNGDTNSTLVAGATGGGGQKSSAGQPVPVLMLTPDNKKFAPLERAVVGILKIGRYVNNQPQSDDMITFKSKVISRNHAEIWSVNGEVYIRDTKSQSGTFLNAMRLSEPSKESKPYRLKPGDVIQFGVDYKGATEDNARCISVRVDLKMKVIDPSMSGGGGQMMPSGDRSHGTSENQDTLVGQQGEGTTLVGNGGGKTSNSTRTNMSGDRTLVGQQNDGTLFHEKPPEQHGGAPYGMPPAQQPRPQMIPNRPGMNGPPRPGGPQILSAPGGIVPGPGMRPPMNPPGMRPPAPMGMQR